MKLIFLYCCGSLWKENQSEYEVIVSIILPAMPACPGLYCIWGAYFQQDGSYELDQQVRRHCYRIEFKARQRELLVLGCNFAVSDSRQ